MKKNIGKIMITIVVILVFVFIGIILNKDNDTEISNANDNKGISEVIIEVQGEVNNPGIYLMNYEDRIGDAISIAGGLTVNGSTNGLNLAAKISDGMRIIIPSSDENHIIIRISLNSATIDDLIDIVGLSKTKAQAIISYREEKGGYKSIEEIKNVTGITETIFNKIKDYLIL